MTRNTSPGLGQWVVVSLIVAVSVFLLYKLYQYSGARQFLPTALTIAGIDVGGMDEDQVTELLTERFLEAPVVIYHGTDSFEISPSEAEFTLDLAAMMSRADFQRLQQDFWAGFWGYLWGQPVEVEPVALAASHNHDALRNVLERIASLSDDPAQPPQPVPGTLSFQYGVAGTETNIEASFDDVEAALYRPANREAHLIVEPREPERPAINLLTRLLVNRLQVFEQETNGVASVFVMDLTSGEEVIINGSVAMSGMDLLKIPIALEAYRAIDGLPTLSQRQLVSDTLVMRPDNESANLLLNVIAGEDDPDKGALTLTESMHHLGLENTFMIAPYDRPLRPGVATPATAANSVEGLRTNPDPQIQTTVEDMGTLLSMIYYCAQGQGGTLLAAYANQISPADCQQILDMMRHNKIGSLLEQGVPPETTLAHRHGWISDTHGDAGVVFTPGGDYVIVEMLFKPEWLEWEISSPLLADVSRATYNFFNFDEPYLGEPLVSQ